MSRHRDAWNRYADLLHQHPKEDDQVGVMDEEYERYRHRSVLITDDWSEQLDAGSQPLTYTARRLRATGLCASA